MRAVLEQMTELTCPLPDYDTATRPGDTPVYSTFADAPHAFGDHHYAGTQAQVPTGLPQSSAALALLPPAQHLRSHDHSFLSPDDASYAAYLDGTPRHLPEITSWPSPSQGPAGTPVTVCFRSIYDLDSPPVKVFLVFGQRRCETTLSKNIQPGPMYHYTVTADAPLVLAAIVPPSFNQSSSPAGLSAFVPITTMRSISVPDGARMSRTHFRGGVT